MFYFSFLIVKKKVCFKVCINYDIDINIIECKPYVLCIFFQRGKPCWRSLTKLCFYYKR